MEVNELFSGWEDHPPTNILVKAIVEGLGGGKKRSTIDQYEGFSEMSPAADYAMRSAVSEISVKAGPALPVIHGPDRDLPKPIFDLNALRERNASVASKRKLGNV